MADSTTATIRTTWNGTLVTGLIVAVAKLFDFDINLDDLAPFIPVIMLVIGIFYRASLALAEWKPVIGKILFGINETPTYGELPPPQPPA